jgi:hypothetical protein
VDGGLWIVDCGLWIVDALTCDRICAYNFNSRTK